MPKATGSTILSADTKGQRRRKLTSLFEEVPQRVFEQLAENPRYFSLFRWEHFRRNSFDPFFPVYHLKRIRTFHQPITWSVKLPTTERKRTI